MKERRTFIGFEILKRSVSMVQVLQRYGLLERLHRSGDHLTGPCPLHHGHNTSQFRVSLSKDCWICFGDCHRGGSIVDFVSRKEGIGIREAGLLLQDWFGLSAAHHPEPQAPAHRTQTSEPANNAPLRFALNNLDPSHPYLASRKLQPATLNTFGAGYCRSGSLAGWIAIPIHNALGELVAYAGRWPGRPSNGQPKYRLPKGFRKSLELFNVHRVASEDQRLPLVVVEGFFGCMAIWQAGHRRVVSLMGSMLSDTQAELILKAAGPQGKVILMFDEDEAGRKGRSEAYARLAQWLTVRTIRFEVEGMQPDSLAPDRLLSLITTNGEDLQ